MFNIWKDNYSKYTTSVTIANTLAQNVIRLVVYLDQILGAAPLLFGG